MNGWKKIYLLAYLLVLTAFTGCGTKIVIVQKADGNSTIEMNLELGKVFEKVLDESTAALNEMSGKQKPDFFYAKKIKKSLANAGLKNVKVSSSVGSIPKYAMTNMGTVENVVIQNATTAIGEKAFANNAALRQVAVPSSVISIDKKEK